MPRRHTKPAPARARRLLPLLACIALAIGLVVAGACWRDHARQADTLAAFQKLQGRWQRADGGYIVEIRSVEPGGKMVAAYFNPRPINVATAEASMIGGTLRVFIELRDVNYPGSNYQLTYDAADDRLKGSYFQAALRESYDVYFDRLKP
jgi:hypothetical protein